MGFFARLRDSFMRFMAGRYGNDSLGRFLIVMYFVLWLVELFFRSAVLYWIGMAILVIWVLRAFSRNIPARQKENLAYRKIAVPVGAWFRLQWDRLREIKTNRYRTCPHCRAVVRLPRKRGRHTVRCPKCGERFDVRILF